MGTTRGTSSSRLETTRVEGRPPHSRSAPQHNTSSTRLERVRVRVRFRFRFRVRFSARVRAMHHLGRVAFEDGAIAAGVRVVGLEGDPMLGHPGKRQGELAA